MSFFPSLGPDAAVRNAMTLNPEASRLLIAFHTAVLRGDSPLTAGERELIAAFVSGLNACTYCHGVHAATARAFGVEEALLDPHELSLFDRRAVVVFQGEKDLIFDHRTIPLPGSVHRTLFRVR